MDPVTPYIDFDGLLAMRREATWDFIAAMPGHFLLAAEVNPWLWSVLIGLVLTVSAKGWSRLARFVGGAYIRQGRFE
ncbi:MAG: hypothetical protein IR160_02045 [Salinibacterium sp.]|nr:hypothetical protein [Salinibacterium sp.]MBF0671349.1 hypothetical protein [Salinibacterium sp.]